ncbi:MAG: RsmD family RNA methyltransferase [Pirellulales bacterium]
MGAGATQRERHQGTRQQGAPTRGPDSELRIIGGRLRGSHVAYSGDPRTRPMKERVREAVFNLLGPAVRDSYVLDLFAGTGAMALEAISRGPRRLSRLSNIFPACG